jgi:hypothetical protein
MGIRKQPEIAVMLAGLAFWLFSLYFLYCTIIFRYFGAVGAIMWVQHTARPMQHKPQTQTLSIRLPQELADRLGEVATRYEMTRTAVLIEILTGAIDTWQPAATHSATRPQHDTLSGAIETIRIELDETIDRVARLERATRPATQTATRLHDDATRDAQTLTTQELIDRYGWSPKNGTRNARKNGWIEVGQKGKEIVWRLPQG